MFLPRDSHVLYSCPWPVDLTYSQKHAKVAGADVFRKPQQGQSNQAQNPVANDEGSAKVVLVA